MWWGAFPATLTQLGAHLPMHVASCPPWAHCIWCPKGDAGWGMWLGAAPQPCPHPAELEQHFGANERVMAAKATRLQALEQRVWGLLEEIRERANAYATC